VTGTPNLYPRITQVHEDMNGANWGYVIVTPAISSGVVYFLAWAGELYVVREHDGSVLWQRNVTQEYSSYCSRTHVVHKAF